MMVPGQPGPLRVNVYIDGYNFYYAIRDKAGGDLSILRLAWCNYWKLGERMVLRAFGPGAVLNSVKYFTATIPGELHANPEGLRRKRMWLDALHYGSGEQIWIVHGEFNRDSRHPGEHREKMTDVRMAIGAVRDAGLESVKGCAKPAGYNPHANQQDYHCPCQGVLLVSSDMDFLPVAEMVVQEFRKKAVIAFPLFSHGYTRSAPHVVFDHVLREDLEACFLKDVQTPSGPVRWSDYKGSKVQSMRA